jgi:hypothetical protein
MSLLAADRLAPIHISLPRFSFSPEALVSAFPRQTCLACYFNTTFSLLNHYILVLFKYYFISIRNSDKTLVIVKFRRTIRQSGGSAAIAIPPEVLNALSWKIGDLVELYPEEQKLVVQKG